MTHYRETRVYLPLSLSDADLKTQLTACLDATHAHAWYRDPDDLACVVFVRRLEVGEEEAA